MCGDVILFMDIAAYVSGSVKGSPTRQHANNDRPLVLTAQFWAPGHENLQEAVTATSDKQSTS